MKINMNSCASGVFQKIFKNESLLLSLTSANARILILQRIQFQSEDQTQDGGEGPLI